MTGKRQRYKGLFISSDTFELNRTVIFIGPARVYSFKCVHVILKSC